MTAGSECDENMVQKYWGMHKKIAYSAFFDLVSCIHSFVCGSFRVGKQFSP